jgi:hypothetical protein
MERPLVVPPDQQALLDRYVHAWEDKNLDGFIALLKSEATYAMPPWSHWYLGREAIGRSSARAGSITVASVCCRRRRTASPPLCSTPKVMASVRGAPTRCRCWASRTTPSRASRPSCARWRPRFSQPSGLLSLSKTDPQTDGGYVRCCREETGADRALEKKTAKLPREMNGTRQKNRRAPPSWIRDEARWRGCKRRCGRRG